MFELLTTAVIWGLSFALAKMAVLKIHPFELVTLRLFLAGTCLLSVSKFIKEVTKWTAETVVLVLVLGSLEFAGTYLLYTWSLSFLPSSVVGALTLTTPAFVYLISTSMGAQKHHLLSLGAVALSILGAGFCLPIAALLSKIQVSSDFVRGIALIFASNFLFALANVWLARSKLRNSSSLSVTACSLLVGATISALVTTVTQNWQWQPLLQWNTALLVLYLGFVATGLGFFLWNRGVQRVSATPAAVVGNFKAPFSLLWGALLLGEAVQGQMVLGVFLLTIAAYLLARQKT